MSLPEISNEQQQIIEYLNDYNIIVDAVAGSGKTTTCLFIAKKYITNKILLLTYSSKLKLDSREKVKKHKLNNIEVESFHSFCCKYYINYCFNDNKIKNILNVNMKNIKLINYDIIIIDEVQDMTNLYYELICKINKDNEKIAKYCIIGDKYQNIYGYKGSDERFIINADKYFNFNNLKWKKCNLSYSFRITTEIANFINNCLIENRIISKKSNNNKVRYLISDTFNCKEIVDEIKYYKNLNYKDNDIFILAPSLSQTSNSPLRILSNELIKIGMCICMHSSEETTLTEDIIKNKIVITTFHQSKGLERKIVIICNFDGSYFEYYNKKCKNIYKCPNELYVAITRASEYVTLSHHNKNKYLPFLKNIDKYVHYISKNKIQKEHIKKVNDINIKISVSELLRKIPENILEKYENILKKNCINKINNNINIPSKIKEKNNTYESVSEITGIALPLYYEYIKKNECNIYKHLKNLDKNFNKCKIVDEIKNYIKNIKNKKLKIYDIIKISIAWFCYKENSLIPLNQITQFNWINDGQIKICNERLDKLKISKSAHFEYSCSMKFKSKNIYYNDNNKKYFNEITINGFIDCFDEINNNIYEFKCVNVIKLEHFLQLSIYKYIMDYESIYNWYLTLNEEICNPFDKNIILDNCNNISTLPINYNYYLFNILTNELYILKNEGIKDIIQQILDEKYDKQTIEISDNDFNNNIIKIKSKYI